MRASWKCPECGERVPIYFGMKTASAADDNYFKFRVNLKDENLADVFAHAWTHTERA